MTVDPQKVRIEGVYEQRQPGYFMLRVKVPGGVLSSEQALKVCEIAERFAGGGIHLTTRTSIEFHWLKEGDLAEAARMLQAVGLTSRGACGGAVRGVSCSTQFSDDFPRVQVLARKLHHHFTQNPHFENLPKKFKIGVDAGYEGARHLIQDAGLVLVETDGESARYDVWAAGGLGREPVPGFLLEERVPEERIILLVEALVRVYKQHTPKGKRLKHLLKEIGQEAFRKLLREEIGREEVLVISDGFQKRLTPQTAAGRPERVEARIFAGELKVGTLRRLAELAARHAAGFMALTPEQNVALFLTEDASAIEATQALAGMGLCGGPSEEQVGFRICPGNHECRMGLAPTRDIARDILKVMGPEGSRLSWAIAGCPNSCSQPQLAEMGIVTIKLVKEEGGERRALFDLYRLEKRGAFGKLIRQGIGLDELLQSVSAIG
ncbi:MAG: nitrite and sulfite reductase 4Fe-4S [Geobacteraceae bacterium]|nr:MAG: nitrite and sulfite reductase 4Fe-4S [Geobacteraceae bacterium]